MSAYRSAFALFCAAWFLQLATGILGIATPLALREMGLDATGVGIIAALHAAGFMAGAAYAPQFISRVGNIRCFSAAAAICGIGSLAFYLAPQTGSWAVIRLIQGAGFAVMFSSADSWLGTSVAPEKRGDVLGLYNVIAKAALLVGPVLIIGYSALDPGNYILAALFLAAALIPVCITRQVEPPHSELEAKSLRGLIRVAPSAVIGVFLAGVVNTGTLALLPIFAEIQAPNGEATRYAVWTFAAANIGGLLSQWPLGRLSDKMDRRTVVAGMALVAAGAALMLGLFSNSAGLAFTIGWLTLWGAGSLSFYGICVAHGVDRVRPAQVTQLMSGLLFVWAAGSVIGPVLSGLAMRTQFGPSGLFLLAAGLLVMLTVAMLVRRVSLAGPKEAAQEDWSQISPTSVARIDFDPRTPEALDD